MTVQSYLGVKANTAETSHAKGWEALAYKLQERYPGITDALIDRFKKEQSMDLTVEQFMKFVGCHVKFNDFVLALYESGNNFVAEYIKQAPGPIPGEEELHKMAIDIVAEMLEKYAL
jgi:hypothetical protein